MTRPFNSWILFGIVLYGLLLHCLIWFRPALPSRDETDYARFATHWYRSGEVRTDDIRIQVYSNSRDMSRKAEFQEYQLKPPLLVLAMLGVQKLGLCDPLTGGRLFVVLLSTFLPMISYDIGRRLFRSTRAGLISAAMTVAYPYLVLYGSFALRDVPYVFFAAWFLLQLLILWQDPIRLAGSLWWGLAGLPLGLAACCRFEYLELLPGVLLLGARYWSKCDYTWSRRLACSIEHCGVLLVAATILPLGLQFLLAGFGYHWVMFRGLF